MKTDSIPPAHLSEIATNRFDVLCSTGELLYEETQPEYIEDDGFQFQFRISSALKRKPILAANDPGRREAIGPFVNPDPNFEICRLLGGHVLELSKYCVLRPTLVLHTVEFAEQTKDLDKHDITATLNALQNLQGPHMVLYNCGVEAGSSQGHKHLQIMPRPSPEEFQMFPDKAKLPEDEPICLSNVPFKHWVVGLPENASVNDISSRYQRALQRTRDILKEPVKAVAHNVVMVKEWIIVIPRTSKGVDGCGANGLGMMGIVWVKDQEERDCWTKFRLSKYLIQLGIPNDGPKEDVSSSNLQEC